MSDSEADATSPKFQKKYSKKFVSTRTLIQLVEAKRLLWDRAHPQYREKPAKDLAWQQIFLEFEPAFESLNPVKKHLISNMIIKKWNNVRDAYVKSLKPSSRHKPYVYAEDLQFLDSVLSESIHKRSKKSYQDSFEERLSNDADNDVTDSWVNQVFVDIGETDHDSSGPVSKKVALACSPKEVTEYDENIVTALVNLIQKEEDEDRAFFKSITPAVKQLSQDSKFEFRIQVMKLISNLRLKETQAPKHKVERTCVSDSE